MPGIKLLRTQCLGPSTERNYSHTPTLLVSVISKDTSTEAIQGTTVVSNLLHH